MRATHFLVWLCNMPKCHSKDIYSSSYSSAYYDDGNGDCHNDYLLFLLSLPPFFLGAGFLVVVLAIDQY